MLNKWWARDPRNEILITAIVRGLWKFAFPNPASSSDVNMRVSYSLRLAGSSGLPLSKNESREVLTFDIEALNKRENYKRNSCGAPWIFDSSSYQQFNGFSYMLEIKYPWKVTFWILINVILKEIALEKSLGICSAVLLHKIHYTKLEKLSSFSIHINI